MSATSRKQVRAQWLPHHFILHISVCLVALLKKNKWSVCLNEILLLCLHSSFWGILLKSLHTSIYRRIHVLCWDGVSEMRPSHSFMSLILSVPRFRCEEGESQIWNQAIQWDLQRIWQSRFIVTLFVSITHLQTVSLSLSLYVCLLAASRCSYSLTWIPWRKNTAVSEVSFKHAVSLAVVGTVQDEAVPTYLSSSEP